MCLGGGMPVPVLLVSTKLSVLWSMSFFQAFVVAEQQLVYINSFKYLCDIIKNLIMFF